MGTIISNLKARFGIETQDLKKGLKDGEKAMKEFKSAGGDAVQKFGEIFGVNMGAVNDALSTAGKGMNSVVQLFKAGGSGASKFTIALQGVKLAMTSTGIGALIVALGSIIAYFQKSGEGADKFAKILAQVKSVFNNVIERIVKFGGGLVDIFSGKFQQGWEKMRTAFQGIGEEIKEDWRAAGALADAEDALEDREIELITSLEERRARAAELRLMAKEEIEDQKTKLAYLNEAEALTKSVYADQVEVERERLRIMKEKLALQTKDPTDEQRREIATQEAKINSLLREQASELKGLARERGTLAKQVAEELELEKLKAQNIGMVKADIAGITIPNLAPQLNAMLKAIEPAKIAVQEIMINITDAINGALEAMAMGLGEFIGSLMAGDAGLKDFGRMVAGVFADMAINVGKIAIGAGLAVMGVKEALMSLNPAEAIAAGIALVAIGTAVRGALSRAAGGGGGGNAVSAGPSTGGSFVYDTRLQPQKVEMSGQVELKARGSELVAVINKENFRKNSTT